MDERFDGPPVVVVPACPALTPGPSSAMPSPSSATPGPSSATPGPSSDTPSTSSDVQAEEELADDPGIPLSAAAPATPASRHVYMQNMWTISTA